MCEAMRSGGAAEATTHAAPVAKNPVGPSVFQGTKRNTLERFRPATMHRGEQVAARHTDIVPATAVSAHSILHSFQNGEIVGLPAIQSHAGSIAPSAPHRHQTQRITSTDETRSDAFNNFPFDARSAAKESCVMPM